MNRRDFTHAAAASAALVALGGRRAPGEATGATTPGPMPAEATGQRPLTIAMLVHPDMVLLDLVGPQTIFALLMAKVHLVWKEPKAVMGRGRSSAGLSSNVTLVRPRPAPDDGRDDGRRSRGRRSEPCHWSWGHGRDRLRADQLVVEYDPKPPFGSGTPETAGAAAADEVRRRRAPLLAAAKQAALRAKGRLAT
jgi:hypothetical protein